MLSRKKYLPPQRLIESFEREPEDWKEAYRSQLARTERLRTQVNNLQESIKNYFDWLNVPGSIDIAKSGTYTPTLTEAGVNNISGTPTVNESRWIKVGDIVTVTGSALITSVDAAVTTTFTLTLPVGATGTRYELAGVVNSFYSTCGAGTITASPAGGAICNYDPTSAAGAETVTWVFSYRIVS